MSCYSIDFRAYQVWVANRWKGKRQPERNKTICALGLAGETGEVIEHFKKHLRDGRPLKGNKALHLELGDVLHYWLRLCHHAGVTPEEVMKMNVNKLVARDEKNECK